MRFQEKCLPLDTMNTQKDLDNIQHYLEKILSDDFFAKSTRYSSLLKFLVEETLAGNELKEFIVGQHIFNKNYDSTINDGKVRVYIYNLRKRLKEYYDNNGADDAIVFCLNKGSYNIQFEERVVEEEVTTPHKTLFTWKHIVGSAAVLITASVLFVLNFNSKDLYSWESFMQSRTPNVCVMADQIMLKHQLGDTWGATTHPYANNRNAYKQLKKTLKGDSLRIVDFTFLTKGIPHAVKDLTMWFGKHDADFKLALESELRYKDIEDVNLIYVGQLKTMVLSSEIFLQNSKIFRASDSHFYTLKGDSIVKHWAGFKGEELRSEYAMVSYFPLENGHNAFYFVSNNDIGTMSTVSHFTDPKFLKEFYKQFPSNKAHFNALFRVEGMDRTDIRCELVDLEILE